MPFFELIYLVAIKLFNHIKLLIRDIKISQGVDRHSHSIVLREVGWGNSRFSLVFIFNITNTIFKIDALGCNQTMQAFWDCFSRHQTWKII
jgi:hypothetical protein